MLRGEFTGHHDRASTIPGSLYARLPLLLPFVAVSILPFLPSSVNMIPIGRLLSLPSTQIALHPLEMRLRDLADSALRLLFPSRCVLCGREGDLICEPCRRSFPPRLEADAIPKLTGIRAARAVWPYEGSVREIVRRYKYNGLRSLSPVLASEMTNVLLEWDPPIDLIIHVPVHPARLRERGFDQSELLARELSQTTYTDVVAISAIARLRETAVQARAMSATERTANVRGAFHVPDPEQIRRANILLIDDVLTTGATLTEAARALRRAGAKNVYALTLAHET